MKLLISTDLGITYEPAQGIAEHANDLEALKKLGAFLDTRMVRWVIVDETNPLTVYEHCYIHKATLADMKAHAAATDEPLCMTTDDAYMARLVEANGFAALTLKEMLARAEQEKKGLH